LDKEDVQLINNILSETPWLILNEEVSLDELGFFVGKFDVITTKETLNISILIPADFPFQGLSFFCFNVWGYNHQMENGSLCLTAALGISIQDRLLLELEKLEHWIQKYYVHEEPDSHFEYFTFLEQTRTAFIFEEDSSKPPVTRDYGSFTYGSFKRDEVISQEGTFITYNLGNRNCRWSKSFLTTIGYAYAGLWVMIATPPVVTRRKRIYHWIELLNIFNEPQLREFYTAFQTFKNLTHLDDGFILAVGYYIPPDELSEIHWDMIHVPFDGFKMEKQKGRISIGSTSRIQWCQSTNASYDRIFGRGKLDKNLTESNILLVGTGAIGSSLLISLVRGGCKRISISDGDLIEPGNVCRGEFQFTRTYSNKARELGEEIKRISPFIEVLLYNKIEPIRNDNKNYTSLRNELLKYDYIFDCSTDKYLSLMLDSMSLRGQILNMSITDEAKDLAVVTGLGNIHLLKNSLYNRISPSKGPAFFVATGCWSPTFQESVSPLLS
jgi:hypothetical protein